jgi:mannose-6-phosphate isomerase-like protein (cupin superfamily)
VSGATDADEDRELAETGARAVEAAVAGANGAAHFPAAAVEERFRSGGLLLDLPRYKIDAGRREAPGEVEYHEGVVDVMHVVRGTATVLTGGSMVDPREVAPGELRAAAVEGGEPHELGEGDVLAIPNGVPHQFTEVSDPFLYFVVKVAA